MIIGNGLIAKSCFRIDRKNVLIFASGVSNSMSNDEQEYQREINLLEKNIKTNSKIIYFSSIDEFIINKRYLEHKKNIESIIQNNTNNFIIMKLPQLVGKDGNSKNFLNYIYDNIKYGVEFDVFLTKRSLLDVVDMVNILNFLIEKNYKGFVNINYIELIDVISIIRIIENIIDKKPIIKNFIPINQNINKNTDFVNSLISEMIGDTESYNLKVIKKYFI